ncbi:LysR family transcriptional regulator [Nocardioides sp. CPCC 206349]|uniref:LysR family transcriptional regulator n=1 Tax=Nocardioides sp. CPCC 206349 TaxID=3406465 RepID=UPI003B42B783
MSLTAWKSFVEVCRLGSLSAAATELGYTQSAISRQVAALEREVGVPLLTRTARGVAPTPAGEAFRRHALVVVHEADRAARAALDARAPASPPLAVGATPSLAAGLVPAAVRRLLDERGPVAWRLVPGLSAALSERLLAGEVDVAVVTDAPPGLPDDARLAREPIGVDEMVVVVPVGHAAADTKAVRIEDLADDVWVEDNEGSEALLRRHADRAGVALRIDLVAADLPGKLAMVATGHALALVPGSLTAALRPDVVPVRLVDAPTRGLYAVTLRRSPHPLAEALLDHLRGLGGPDARPTDASEPERGDQREGRADHG